MTKAEEPIPSFDLQTIADPTLALNGVHHTARPTWKLSDTVHFYRDVMGLKLCHAITARGWGPEDHPDFIHFFFESGSGSTIAFFYYLKAPEPPESVPFDSWLYRSVHTAWRVPTREVLLAWKEKLASHGYQVLHVRHEIIESIYVTDPNGYMIEVSWQTRPMEPKDAVDATLTVEAAMSIERRRGERVESIDEVWRAKAALVEQLVERQD